MNNTGTSKEKRIKIKKEEKEKKKILILSIDIPYIQGADFKNNQTTKQLNNFIWTNRKQVKFFFSIGLNKFF